MIKCDIDRRRQMMVDQIDGNDLEPLELKLTCECNKSVRSALNDLTDVDSLVSDFNFFGLLVKEEEGVSNEV